MPNGISNMTNWLDMGPVTALVTQQLNTQTGQQSCSEVAEFLGYPCAPMPLCG
ncbi:hypothetical protein [Pseudomonas segetis]|uniref:Uncharacterized protein n=1 Tax=Pseudomonas segetis TaxID=298908 RepID=A0A239CHQ2_9PSED|nr:hypothetical protein [Pseudomonas segetis]SNS19640.1 hypothetical protein SAMN05216255_1719 [Pseudomonas segetis]